MNDYIRQEFRLMDKLPRNEAYVSMFILGACIGIFAAAFLYVAATALIFFTSH